MTVAAFLGAAPPSESVHAEVAPDLQRLIDAAPSSRDVLIIAQTHDPMDASALVSSHGGRLDWNYEILPGFAAWVPHGNVESLARDGRIASLSLARDVHANLDVSTRAIEADHAWSNGYDGAGVTVAVLDTGVDRTDPALSDAVVSCVAVAAGVTLPECDDTDGHGTHVAGIVASRDAKYRGVAPGASLAIVRVLHAGGVGTSADIIAGMDWVASHKDSVSPRIRVATMSIGYSDPGCGDGRAPEAVAADHLVAAGIPFTIAAGNSGHTSCTVDGASAAFNVITVGASDDHDTPAWTDDTLASFSSGGPTVDGRMKPELVAPGVGITSLFIGPLYATMDGTSMATPHVAGVAALLLEKEPSLTPPDVKSRLMSTTVRPPADPSSANDDWGTGLVNACRALELMTC